MCNSYKELFCIITQFLEGAGASVECAENGEEALSCAKKTAFDIVLMDIQLPVMDGYEATSRLRGEGFETPIIALTAHASVENQVNSKDAGFDAFLSKPVDWPKLASTIVRCHDNYRLLH